MLKATAVAAEEEEEGYFPSRIESCRVKQKSSF
jgi:hypothetical protein